MIQKATLDLAVNNTSSETHIINAVLLEPIDLYASIWAGKMKKAKAKYLVVLDDWHQKLMDAQLKTLETGLGDLQGDAKDASDLPATIRASGFLPTMSVNEIVNDKYTIDRQSQERFQLLLGLTRSIDFLYGNVRVKIKTDRGAELVSAPLSVVVCTPDSSLQKDNEKN